MATRTFAPSSGQAADQPALSGVFIMVVAFLAALAGLAYSVSFVFIKENLWNGLFLMLGGLLGGLVLATLYSILKATDSGLALIGLLLATVGMGGAIIHGGYDLALGVNPVPALPAGVTDLPSQVDPRGLLTFGISGLAIAVFTWLMQRSRQFLVPLIYTGWFLALLMEILYLGRLIILDAKNPLIVVAALLAGFIVSPLWYILVGLRLQKEK